MGENCFNWNLCQFLRPLYQLYYSILTFEVNKRRIFFKGLINPGQAFKHTSDYGQQKCSSSSERVRELEDCLEPSKVVFVHVVYYTARAHQSQDSQALCLKGPV